MIAPFALLILGYRLQHVLNRAIQPLSLTIPHRVVRRGIGRRYPRQLVKMFEQIAVKFLTFVVVYAHRKPKRKNEIVEQLVRSGP